MKKAFIFGALLFSIYFFLTHRSEDNFLVTSEPVNEAQELEGEESIKSQDEEIVEALPRDIVKNKNLEKLQLPKLSAVRSDVEAHEHETSRVIKEFARELTPHLAQAYIDKTYVEKVIGFLGDCIHDSELSSLSVYCYKNAELLSGHYQNDFLEQVQLLKGKLDQQSQTILKAIDQD